VSAVDGTRVVAVDWSGRRTGARNHIYLAEAAGGTLLRVEAGRTREEVAEHLVELSHHDANLVVGLDFSFSLPSWYLDEEGLSSADALWAAAAVDGERWLRDCERPWWGRPGRRRPELPGHFRATELALGAVGGISPKSTFQVGGAGAVGTGSVRGFPVLAVLRSEGFAVWPFHEPATPPVAVEIYPRALTGPVVKTDPAARAAYLAEHLPELAPELRATASGSEDAFDAAVSAVVMSRHTDALSALPPAVDETTRREGCVWVPLSR